MASAYKPDEASAKSPEFRKGDLVQVIDPRSDFLHQCGIIVRKYRAGIETRGSTSYDVKMRSRLDGFDDTLCFFGADLAGVDR